VRVAAWPVRRSARLGHQSSSSAPGYHVSMAAVCEISECGVVAVARCIDGCGLAVCDSHRARILHHPVVGKAWAVGPREETLNLCTRCHEQRRAATDEAERRRTEEQDRSRVEVAAARAAEAQGKRDARASAHVVFERILASRKMVPAWGLFCADRSTLLNVHALVSYWPLLPRLRIGDEKPSPNADPDARHLPRGSWSWLREDRVRLIQHQQPAGTHQLGGSRVWVGTSPAELAVDDLRERVRQSRLLNPDWHYKSVQCRAISSTPAQEPGPVQSQQPHEPFQPVGPASDEDIYAAAVAHMISIEE
jgi:hypothetical protein